MARAGWARRGASAGGATPTRRDFLVVAATAAGGLVIGRTLGAQSASGHVSRSIDATSR